MCDPVSALVVGSAALGATATVQQGLSAASVARYNARIAQKNSADQEALARNKSERDIASQTVALGAQGTRVDTGTPLLLLSESARNAELDALTIRSNGAAQAANYKAQADNATTGAIFGAGAQLLGGAAKLYELGKIGPANSNSTAKTGS